MKTLKNYTKLGEVSFWSFVVVVLSLIFQVQFIVHIQYYFVLVSDRTSGLVLGMNSKPDRLCFRGGGADERSIDGLTNWKRFSVTR